jgi:hypothetical protein
VSDAAEERFRQMTPEERERYRAGVADGSIEDFGGAPGSEAQWAYGGQSRPTIPGEAPHAWQLEAIERLAKQKGVEVDAPADAAAANRLLSALRGPDTGPSEQQMDYLGDLTERLGRSQPRVSTSREAQREIAKLSRIEHAQNPDMKPSKGQLDYISRLAGGLEDLNLGVNQPGSAIGADRLIGHLQQLQREDPGERMVTRNLLVAPADEFESVLRSLRPNEQAVLRARYREGLDERETATALRMTPHDVGVIETVARHKFNRALEIGKPAARAQGANVTAIQSPQAGA